MPMAMVIEVMQAAFIELSIAIIAYESKVKNELSGINSAYGIGTIDLMRDSITTLSLHSLDILVKRCSLRNGFVPAVIRSNFWSNKGSLSILLFLIIEEDV